MSDTRPTAASKLSPEVRAQLEAAAKRGVVTAQMVLGTYNQTGLRKAPRRDDEFEIQCAFFKIVDAHPVWRALPIYAIPNFFGNYGTEKQRQLNGARANAAGRRKAAPDVNIDVARGEAHGLRIEFKTSTGTVRPDQKAFHASLERQGFRVHICRSADEAVAVLADYLAQNGQKQPRKASGQPGVP